MVIDFDSVYKRIVFEKVAADLLKSAKIYR